jgi:phospholipase C
MNFSAIQHVVILMQENRSFDQYFGTFPGATGFGDPNFPPAGTLPYLPFRASTFSTNGEAYHGDDHGWSAMHQAYSPPNGCFPDLMDSYNVVNGICPGYGYAAANDIPYHWILASTFTLCDHWFASVLGPTAPNRLYLMSGCMRSPPGPSSGADRAPETIGDPNTTLASDPSVWLYNQNPLTWSSYVALLEAAIGSSGSPAITWNVYDETGDTSFHCNPPPPNFIPPPYPNNGWGTLNILNAFANRSSSNWTGGTGQGFNADARNGTLPTISWIMPPFGASEWHNFPSDGAQYIAQKLDALLTEQPNGSSVWDSTVFIIIYDENDDAFDHVDPQPPGPNDPNIAGTVEAFVTSGSTDLPIGPGYRSPAFIISPWTVNLGKPPGWNISGVQPIVNSQPADHTAVLQLLELVTAAILPPNGVPCTNIGAWRRLRFPCGAAFWNNILSGPPATASQVRALIPQATDVSQYQYNTQLRLYPYYGTSGGNAGSYYPAPSQDAPWPPVPQQCYFQVLSQTSFSLDDVQAANNVGTTFNYAVVLDGFDPNEMAKLAIVTSPQSNPPPPRGLTPTLYLGLSSADPSALGGMSVSITGIAPSVPTAPATNSPAISEPQRWTVSFDLVFNNPSTAFQNVSLTNPIYVTLSATFSSNLDWSDAIPIELVAGADPFMLSGQTWYLSRDVRAYEVLDDGTANNVFGMAFGPDPNTYLQSVLDALNGGNPGNNPAIASLLTSFASDPEDSLFATLEEAALSQASYYPTEDGTPGAPNIYNFAIARVTLQGLSAPANNVQVFFRLFPAPSSGTNYDPTTTYPASADLATGRFLPLVGFNGSQVASLPFFAANRNDVNVSNPDLPNWRQSIAPLSSGQAVDTYFGCYLDLNHGDTIDVNGVPTSIASIAASQHQCLVAQLSFQGVSIQTGDNPGVDTDKLAQRNLAVLGGTG